LTSAGHDVRDVYAEQLCERDGSKPTRESKHYWYKGRCRAMEPSQPRAFPPVEAGALLITITLLTIALGTLIGWLAGAVETPLDLGRDGLNRSRSGG
jgi:hypothetical protein